MNNRKHLGTGFLVLGMMAVAPLAFAQATPPPTGQQPTEATSPPATGAAEQQASQSSASGQGLSWADLDTDGNGSLDKQEAQRHAALSSVFAQIDADGNDEVTTDEYRAFIQKQQDGAANE